MALWLNGVEIMAANMPARPVAYNNFTLPNGAPGEPVVVISNLVARGLVQGDNVLSVQLQQSGSGSSDDVFTMNLWAIPGQPLVITQQPVSKVVAEAHPVNLTVGVSGSLPGYQCY